MMDDILKQIKAGEVSGMQFNERILDKYDIACELVAYVPTDLQSVVKKGSTY